MPSSTASMRALAIAALSTGLAAAECWQDAKCIFHVYNRNNEITQTWDLRNLCNNGNGYKFYNASTSQYFAFEICGSITPQVPVDSTGGCTPAVAYQNSAQTQYGETPVGGWPGVTQPQGCTIPGTNWETWTYCNAEYNSYPFRGNVIQYLEYRPAPAGQPNSKITQCQLGGGAGTADNKWTPPNSYNDGTNGDVRGYANYCATTQCEVLSYGNAAYDYQYLDRNNPKTGGIRWVAYGDTPDQDDEFQCASTMLCFLLRPIALSSRTNSCYPRNQPQTADRPVHWLRARAPGELLHELPLRRQPERPVADLQHLVSA